MKKGTFLLLFLFALLTCNAQKTKTVFLDSDDNTKSKYTVFYPSTMIWKGYLFLLPGFGETLEDVLLETDLPQRAAKQGLLVIIPTLQDGALSFGIDETSQKQLEIIIDDVRNKHKLLDLRFFIGGFSLGGSAALKYAEETTKKPAAVFAIDSPLDFERFYNSSIREVRLSGKEQANEESLYMINRIEKEFGGTPSTALASFHTISPYSFSDASQAAARKLIDVPLRLYTEPDVNWWIQERGEDFSSMNALDCSALINELNRLGNHNTALIPSVNKGYRKKTNTKHPHAWSIVNIDELLSWLFKQ